MRCEFSRSVLDAILAEAMASPAQEVCGLLLGEPALVKDFVICGNMAADPATAFEIDPAQLIAVHRAERNGGPAIVGCYHSHPDGPATPSARDAATEPNGWLWLIVGQGNARCWHATSGGALHGRFDPVEMEVLTVAARR